MPPSDSRRDSPIDRRSFLRMSLGASGALALGCAEFGTVEDIVRGNSRGEGTGRQDPAVDSHIHLWSGNQGRFPRAARYDGMVLKPRRYEPRDFLALASIHGVERAVAVQAPCYAGDHTYLLSVIEAHPDRFAGVGSLDFTKDLAGELHELAKMGLRGGRLSVRRAAELAPSRTQVDELFEASYELGLPLCLMSEPEFFEPISNACARHPRTLVVLDHAGRPAPGVQTTARAEDLEALTAMADHPNLYVKVSGFHMLGRASAYNEDVLPLVYRAAEAFGPKRLMWGSDAPQQLRNDHKYPDSLKLIRQAASDLSAEDRDWVLRRTAEKVFFPELASTAADA